jgi:hypothetical protein
MVDRQIHGGSDDGNNTALDRHPINRHACLFDRERHRILSVDGSLMGQGRPRPSYITGDVYSINGGLAI